MKLYEISCVYVPHYYNFDFKLSTDAKIQPAIFYRQGGQLLLIFLPMVTLWLCSTCNFYGLSGQNLTGEFTRKIYSASCNLFTLIDEAEIVLCQL